MSIDSSTLLFFDASCFIAAAGSPSGGSSFLFSLCTRGLLRGSASHLVLLEVERNLQTKFTPEALLNYHRLIQSIPLVLTDAPSSQELHRFQDRVNAKDVHVIAAAVEVAAAYLITLDKPLEEQVNTASVAVLALSPGVFITAVLPTHVDYPTIR